MTPAVLVLAKAPRPGRVKTRLGAEIGHEAAADLAALALLDTLDAARSATSACHLALAGDLSGAAREHELRAATEGWRVFAQQGTDFAARIVHAHAQVAGPVLQIGMDTPQVTRGRLAEAGRLLDTSPAVLGPAHDGGWWLLGLRDPLHAEALRSVPMSRPDTGRLTAEALRERGLDVATAGTLRDVDTAVDAGRVADADPTTRFARAWHALASDPASRHRGGHEGGRAGE